MGGVSATSPIRRDEYVVSGVNPDIVGIPEEQFFALQRAGQDTGEYFPLPSGVTHWNNALYKGSKALFAEVMDNVFFILEDTNYGLALFHYVYAKEDHSELRWCNNLPFRSIKKPKGVLSMSRNLNDLAHAAAQQRGVAPMNLPGGPAYNPVMPAVSGYQAVAGGGDGITNGVANYSDLVNQAKAGGYVFGYIMKNAPAITIGLRRQKNENNDYTYSLQARQSKPSGLLKVLMALPARCIKHNGALAKVEEIMNGVVDYNTIAPDEMFYFAIDEIGAAGYITALGGAIPEYRPNVLPNQKTQWSRSEIVNDSSDVSFVVVKATQRKKTNVSTTGNNNDDSIRYHLRVEGARRTLYTQHNIMCLRALEHVPVPSGGCVDESQAYRLNECAFGGWRYRDDNSSDTTAKGQRILKVAMHKLPSQIWQKRYENVAVTREDGSQGVETREDGIGSVYFMVGDSEQTEHSEMVKREQLYYTPWWSTGKNKEIEPVPAIVKRTLMKTKDGLKTRTVNSPIYWKDVRFNKDENGMFAPYRKFAEDVIKLGFETEEALKTLTNRAGRAKGKTKDKQAKHAELLSQLLIRSDVQAALDSVQAAASRRQAARPVAPGMAS